MPAQIIKAQTMTKDKMHIPGTLTKSAFVDNLKMPNLNEDNRRRETAALGHHINPHMEIV
jgi:hypothetical protein